MIRCHVDGRLVAEEVGSVQHVHVQGVALDPFPAVDQFAKLTDRIGDGHTEGILDGVDRTGLVRHRADPADPRGDVRRLHERPAPQEGLEEPGWLEDLEVEVDHLRSLQLEVHGAFALHPGEVVDGDGSFSHENSSIRSRRLRRGRLLRTR